VTPAAPPRKPYGHQLPQIVTEGTLRHSLKSDVITFKLRLLRLIELTFLVVLPREGSVKSPVFVRMYVDPTRQDLPGTTIID
jgi:hypothetical protein